MSTGDVIVFDEIALSVDRCGFVRVALEPTDLITHQTWSQAIDKVNTKRAAGSVLDA